MLHVVLGYFKKPNYMEFTNLIFLGKSCLRTLSPKSNESGSQNVSIDERKVIVEHQKKN